MSKASGFHKRLDGNSDRISAQRCTDHSTTVDGAKGKEETLRQKFLNKFPARMFPQGYMRNHTAPAGNGCWDHTEGMIQCPAPEIPIS